MENNASKFDEEFITNYDEDNNKGYIIEVDIHLKIYITSIAIYHSYQEE